jgi:hypothetical protein
MIDTWRRIRGALVMGVTWAAAWGLGGVLIALGSRFLPGGPPHFDAPPPAMAYPGFVGGVLFSVILGIAARRRRFSELSVRQFAAWGAASGLAVSLVPAALVALGLADTHVNVWLITGALAVPLSALCAASAAGSLLLARKTERIRPAIADVTSTRQAAIREANELDRRLATSETSREFD